MAWHNIYWHLMMLQFSEITQSRVFNGAKLESKRCFPPFYGHLEEKMDWQVVSVI